MAPGLREETKRKKRIKVDALPALVAAPYLDSDEAIASCLTDILQANDAGLLPAALGDIASARCMTDIAKAAGTSREALYKALRPGSALRFDAVNRGCAALARLSHIFVDNLWVERSAGRKLLICKGLAATRLVVETLVLALRQSAA
jgi:probable addiction module antidote protein